MLQMQPAWTLCTQLCAAFKLIASAEMVPGAEYRATAMIGEKPVTSVIINGVELNCLMDTGSQVSFITEACYKEHFNKSNMKSINCLTIRAADGLSIPYVGYFEASVTLNDSVLCDRAILVIKDNGDMLC